MKKQVFKNEVLTRTKVRNNILKIWEQTTDADRYDWYAEAQRFAKTQDLEYHLPVATVCGVIAALSPMVSWERNKELTIIALINWEAGNSPETMPCLKANARKAWEILGMTLSSKEKMENEILDILKGDKVSSFFLNILYPDQAISITIDRHALSICMGQWLTEESVRTMTAKQYEFFSECYRWTAAQLGINPLVLQSATWLVWRRIKKQYQ